MCKWLALYVVSRERIMVVLNYFSAHLWCVSIISDLRMKTNVWVSDRNLMIIECHHAELVF